MDSISGLESAHSYKENQQNSVSKDGMNGWIPASKKQTGPEQKIKNYYNSLEFFPVSGELLLPSLEEHPHNVMKDMKNY